MAMFRGNHKLPIERARETSTFFNGQGKAKFGINAGVIILKPSVIDLGK